MDKIYEKHKFLIPFSIGFLLGLLFIIPQIQNLFIYIAETKILQRELRDVNKWKYIMNFLGIIIPFASLLIFYLKKKIILFSYVTIIFISIVIRLPELHFESGDYKGFIEPWITHLANNNHLFGIATISSDYSPFYLFILGFISFLPESLWLLSVKMVSCLFDFFLAFICGQIVLTLSKSKEKTLIAFSLILLCPTVFLNSSVWGQCDVIYVSFLFVPLLLFIKDKNNPALFIYGISLTIKLQAIFILPFIIILFLNNKFKLQKFIFLILGFICTAFVALPFGGFNQFISSFFTQITSYSEHLTLNAPSLYALFNVNSKHRSYIKITGILITFTILASLALYTLYITKNKGKQINVSKYIIIFFFCALIVPFFLPKMHERYFYIAEISAIIYAVLYPKRFWVSILVILPSCATYFYYLFGNTVNLQHLALMMLTSVVFVFKWTFENLNDSSLSERTIGCRRKIYKFHRRKHRKDY